MGKEYFSCQCFEFKRLKVTEELLLSGGKNLVVRNVVPNPTNGRKWKTRMGVSGGRSSSSACRDCRQSGRLFFSSLFLCSFFLFSFPAFPPFMKLREGEGRYLGTQWKTSGVDD